MAQKIMIVSGLERWEDSTGPSPVGGNSAGLGVFRVGDN